MRGLMLIAVLVGGPQAHADGAAAIEAAVRDYVLSHPSLAGVQVELNFRPARGASRECQGPLVVSSASRRLVGRVNLQVRCASPAWGFSQPVRIEVPGDFWVASAYLPAGTVLSSRDLRKARGDLAMQPEDVVRSDSRAIGRTLLRSVSEGEPIGLNTLRENAVVKVGERIRISIAGSGFSVSGEATALSGGAVGESVRLKLPDGQQASGVVVKPGHVEVRLD